MMMNEREQWIVNYLTDNEGSYIDTLNSTFVESYLKSFGYLKFYVTAYGAYRCQQLGKDLLSLYRKGILTRCAVGLSSMPVDGFPKWVYVYELA